MRWNRLSVAAVAVLLLGTSVARTVPAQECQCNSNAAGRLGGVLGGGLFAGLVAAVLHFAQGPAPVLAPSVVPVSIPDPVEPPVIASASGALAPAAAPAKPAQVAAAPAPAHTRGSRPLSPGEARDEGLIPPRTATIFPALAMIGVGSLLLGLFLMRERKRRSWW